MDILDRLKWLSLQMTLEPDGKPNLMDVSDGAPDCSRFETQRDNLFVYPAALPNGRRIRLLKTLLSSVCERDCHYCPFRAGRDFRRATFTPEEFARLFLHLYERGIADGLFISSGLAGGGIRTQDRLIETAEILRLKLGFKGYLHLKIMPGAEKAQVERAMQLADRVSINLEAPSAMRLNRLAPHKTFFNELLTRLRWVDEIRQSLPPQRGWKGHWPSSTTQFVAGGADESDLELLQTSEFLYRHLHLKRVYYMGFHPISDTPLENHPPTPALRQLRLYQASFLLRDYGFGLDELPFEAGGNLPVGQDPKQAWAEKNLLECPIEINRAEWSQLLRIPGIGPRTAKAILKARRTCTLRDLSSLKKLGIVVERAAPYILLDGRRAPVQPVLFSSSLIQRAAMHSVDSSG
mgnify:CR=1 FL=1